jgi:hypothetical protein
MAPELPDEESTRLTARANALRSGLSETLHAIDGRWREVSSLRVRIVGLSAAAAPFALVLTSGILAIGVYRLATARERRRFLRWEALRRAWTHPEDVAVHGGGSTLRKLAGAVAMLALRAFATRIVLPAIERRTGAGPGRSLRPKGEAASPV